MIGIDKFGRAVKSLKGNNDTQYSNDWEDTCMSCFEDWFEHVEILMLNEKYNIKIESWELNTSIGSLADEEEAHMRYSPEGRLTCTVIINATK